MKYAALSPDQIYRLNQCAPAVMEIMSNCFETLMRERITRAALQCWTLLITLWAAEKFRIV